MKVYFACSSASVQDHLDDYNLIREILKQNGLSIVADWIDRSFNKSNSLITTDVEINIHDEGINAINDADIFVADVSYPSASVGFQVGLALSKKIPVLCLYSEEFGDKEAPQVIKAINSPLLVISGYNSKNIGKIIKKFIKVLPENKLIKFNFIITPKIAEYLDDNSRLRNVSKSDFLREIVEKAMETD